MLLPLRLAASGYAEVEVEVGSGPGCSEVERVFELEGSVLVILQSTHAQNISPVRFSY